MIEHLLRQLQHRDAASAPGPSASSFSRGRAFGGMSLSTIGVLTGPEPATS
jgi:hypothetical protein